MSVGGKTISVVIPCRNEAGHIARVVKKVPAGVDEIILVNNRSTDNTLDVCRKLAKHDKRILALEDQREIDGIGYGYAHQTGMRYATGDFIVAIDGDDTYPAKDIVKLVNRHALKNRDVTICYRPLGQLPVIIRVGVWILNLEYALLNRRRVYDILSGMWIVSRSALPRLSLKEGGWNFSPEIKHKSMDRSDIKFAQVPITINLRRGTSKQNYLKTGLQHLGYIFTNRAKRYSDGSRADTASLLKRYWPVYVAFIAAFAAAGYVALRYRYSLEVDGVSYLQVAEHYANANLPAAINGYWSPLISWLLIPIFWLPIEPLWGFRLLQMAIVVTSVTLLGVYIIRLQRAQHNKLLLTVFLSSLGLTMAQWSTALTPDLLSAVIFSAALVVAVRWLVRPSRKISVVLGVLFALSYFAKSAGLLVALAAIAILWVFMYRRKSVGFMKPLLVSFAVLVIPWIVAISVKYQRPTISTAGSINWALIGPETRMNHQIMQPGLILEPPNDGDMWAWNDPTYSAPEPWSFGDNLGYYAARTFKNFRTTIELIATATPLLLAGIVLLLRRQSSAHHAFTLAIASLLVVTVLYGFVAAELRYILIGLLPIVALGALELSKKISVSTRLIVAATCVAALLVASAQITFDGNKPETALSYRYSALQAAKYIEPGARIAGNNIYRYQICYYTDTLCVGNFQLSNGKGADIEALRRANVDYYIDIGNTSALPLEQVAHIPGKPAQCRDAELAPMLCEPVPLTIYRTGR